MVATPAAAHLCNGRLGSDLSMNPQHGVNILYEYYYLFYYLLAYYFYFIFDFWLKTFLRYLIYLPPETVFLFNLIFISFNQVRSPFLF